MGKGMRGIEDAEVLLETQDLFRGPLCKQSDKETMPVRRLAWQVSEPVATLYEPDLDVHPPPREEGRVLAFGDM